MRFERLQAGLILLIIPLGLLYLYMEKNDVTLKEIFYPGTAVLQIDDLPVRVEVADEPRERAIGLSGRKEFPSVNGMFFIFDEPDYHGIWMKDMYFSIDIIWVSEDLTVVGIERDVRPDTYPRTFYPPEPVKYVLETDVKYADTFGINVGDKVRLPVLE